MYSTFSASTSYPVCQEAPPVVGPAGGLTPLARGTKAKLSPPASRIPVPRGPRRCNHALRRMPAAAANVGHGLRIRQHGETRRRLPLVLKAVLLMLLLLLLLLLLLVVVLLLVVALLLLLLLLLRR